MIGFACLAGLDGRELAFGIVLIARDFLGDEYFERLIGVGNGRIECGAVVAEACEMTIELTDTVLISRQEMQLSLQFAPTG